MSKPVQRAYSELTSIALVSRVDFFDIVFGVFDYYFVWVPVQVEDDWDLVLDAILDPPGFETKRLDLVLFYKRVVQGCQQVSLKISAVSAFLNHSLIIKQ